MKLSMFLSPPIEGQGLILVNVFYALTVVEAQFKLVKLNLVKVQKRPSGIVIDFQEYQGL